MKKTVKALNFEPLDFVLVPGDLLLDGEWENLQVAKGLLDTLIAPYFIVSGNHDYKPVDSNRMRKQFNYLSTEEFMSEFVGHG
jgi:Icc protein